MEEGVPTRNDMTKSQLYDYNQDNADKQSIGISDMNVYDSVYDNPQIIHHNNKSQPDYNHNYQSQPNSYSNEYSQPQPQHKNYSGNYSQPHAQPQPQIQRNDSLPQSQNSAELYHNYPKQPINMNNSGNQNERFNQPPKSQPHSERLEQGNHPNFNNYIGGQNNNYNPYAQNIGVSSIGDTKVFMNKVDISCEDHKKHYDITNIDAVRFCSKCKILCCSDCVIEFHNEHIQDAKSKIEEYFSQQKNELESIKSANNANLHHKRHLEDVLEAKNELERRIDGYTESKIAKIKALKTELDICEREINSTRDKIKENVDKFYTIECYKRLERPLKNLENGKFYI